MPSGVTVHRFVAITLFSPFSLPIILLKLSTRRVLLTLLYTNIFVVIDSSFVGDYATTAVRRTRSHGNRIKRDMLHILFEIAEIKRVRAKVPAE